MTFPVMKARTSSAACEHVSSSHNSASIAVVDVAGVCRMHVPRFPPPSTPRLVSPVYTSAACARAKPNNNDDDDDAMEPWFRVDTSLLATYQTHTRAPCVYSTLASVTTVSKSLVERVVVRASPRSLFHVRRKTHNAHTPSAMT